MCAFRMGAEETGPVLGEFELCDVDLYDKQKIGEASILLAKRENPEGTLRETSPDTITVAEGPDFVKNGQGLRRGPVFFRARCGAGRV